MRQCRVVAAGVLPTLLSPRLEVTQLDREDRALELVEAAITPRTRAIIPVDQIGLAADMTRITPITRRHGIVVIEDAAPALGATVAGARVGSLADLTCFSFHPRKSITTGEGGMIATDDDAAADRLRRIRSHGASSSDLARH